MSARTTAHLASACDDFYHEYIRLRGIEEARLFHQSQSAAIERIAAIAQTENIACDFTRLDGYLILAEGDDSAILQREREACDAIGFLDVEWLAQGLSGGFAGRPALRFPYQARFHPLKYLEGLMDAIERMGGKLFAHTPVGSVEESEGAVNVMTNAGHTLSAGAAIVATNSPINDMVAIHTKQAPYRTYVVAARVPQGAVQDALYWDTLDPYHYARLQEAEDGGDPWLIVGGEDHKTGEAHDHEARLAALEDWTRAHFENVGPVEHRWSGQVMEPVDNAPFVGRNPGDQNVYVVTGDSGQGMTNGAMAGMLLRDLVLGAPNGWEEAYRPQRKTLRAAGEYLSENATMATNLAQYVSGGQVARLDDLKAGQGAIVRIGTAKVAAFRDEGGSLHVRSAACSHAGCIVQWNAFERCWDCPCHGSQFGIDGEPQNGPAISGLPEYVK